MNIVQRLRYPLSGSESSEEIAYRLAVGCSPGMVIQVREDFFRVLHTRPVMVRRTTPNSVGDAPVALVEDPSTSSRPITIPPPKVTSEEQVIEAKAETPQRRSSRPPAPVLSVRVGQEWVSKDARRQSSTFKLVAVDQVHAVTEDGRKIQIQRFNRYRLVAEAS